MTQEKTSTEIWSIVSDRDKCTIQFMNQKWLPSDKAILIEDVIYLIDSGIKYYNLDEKMLNLLDELKQKLKSRGRE